MNRNQWRLGVLLAVVFAASLGRADGPFFNDAVRLLLDEPGESQWRLQEAEHQEHPVLGHGFDLTVHHATLPVEVKISGIGEKLFRIDLIVRTEKASPFDEGEAIAKTIAAAVRMTDKQGLENWTAKVRSEAEAVGLVFGEGDWKVWTLGVGRKQGVRSVAWSYSPE